MKNELDDLKNNDEEDSVKQSDGDPLPCDRILLWTTHSNLLNCIIVVPPLYEIISSCTTK